MKSKKAIATEVIWMIFSVFLAASFFIAFLIVTTKSDDPERDITKIRFESLNQNIMLLGYLSTPVNISGISNVADLIILTINDRSKLPELEKISEKILTPLYKDKDFWRVVVYDENKKFLFEFRQQAYKGKGLPSSLDEKEQILPSNSVAYKTYIVELIKY